MLARMKYIQARYEILNKFSWFLSIENSSFLDWIKYWEHQNHLRVMNQDQV